MSRWLISSRAGYAPPHTQRHIHIIKEKM